MIEQFQLRPHPPFRLDLTAWALRRRPHNNVDRFDGETYRRVIVLSGKSVEVAVRQVGTPAAPHLFVELRGKPAALDGERLLQSRSVLERTLGLEADLTGFYRFAASDARLAPLSNRFNGVHPPRFPSVFEAAVNAVACQQLSLEVGIHLLNRLAFRYGPTASSSRDAPRGFPLPERLAEADPETLSEMGFSRAKARAIIELAQRVATGELDLESLVDATDNDALTVLSGLRGIGRWSAEYTLLRGLGRWHVLPGDDIGAANNLRRLFNLADVPDYAQIHELTQAWSPYGGLVYFHLLLDRLDFAGHLLGPAPPSTDLPPSDTVS